MAPFTLKSWTKRTVADFRCCLPFLAIVALASAGDALAQTQRQVTVGVPEAFPPYYLLNEDGDPTGFAVDVMNEVAKRAGLEVTYRVAKGLPATVILEWLRAGDIDIIPSLGISDHRKQYVAFTQPVDTFRVVLFVRDDTQDVTSIDDLMGRPIAVVENNVGHRFLKKKHPEIQLKVFPKFADALFALLSAKVDAFAYPEPVTWKLAREAGVSGQIKVAAKPLKETKRALGVRKDRVELLAVLDRAVEEFIASPDYQKVYVTWFGKAAPYWTVARVAWTMGGILAVLLAIIVSWHYRSVIRLNRALRLSEADFKDLYDNAPDMYCSIDAKTAKILQCNDTFAAKLGYGKDEIIGQPVLNFYHPGSIETAKECMRTFTGTGRAESDDLKVVRKDGGTFDVSLRVSAIRDEQGNIVSSRSVWRDITVQKRAEAALTVAKDEAERANNAKSDFLSSMSHELRTPLNAILGFTQILNTDPDHPLTEKQMDATEQVLKSGDHLLSLIEDVLDLASIESEKASLDVEPQDPAPVIKTCVSIFQTLAGQKGLRFFDRTAGWNLPQINIDATRFQQVLLNLLSNAVKYNCDGGTVTLSVGEGEGGGDAGAVRFSVTDSGRGIAAEKHGQIFAPFSRLGLENSDITGTGIGLTITRELTEAMGGTIGFESTLDLGSTFWLEFPIVSGELTARDFDDPADDFTMKAKHTVLCIEDSPSSLKLLEMIIGRFPETIMISAHTGELGIDLAEIHRPDVILMDLNLPGIDGFETLNRLKASSATKNIPVIALTARASDKDKDRGLEAGFAEYLTKPINVEVVTSTIKQAFQSV